MKKTKRSLDLNLQIVRPITTVRPLTTNELPVVQGASPIGMPRTYSCYCS